MSHGEIKRSDGDVEPATGWQNTRQAPQQKITGGQRQELAWHESSV
jgi:hypothetical protein